jgi:hypothetical protein
MSATLQGARCRPPYKVRDVGHLIHKVRDVGHLIHKVRVISHYMPHVARCCVLGVCGWVRHTLSPQAPDESCAGLYSAELIWLSRYASSQAKRPYVGAKVAAGFAL